MPKVIVVCPANRTTGGPELLHQFVDELNEHDCEAKIFYYPYSIDNTTPSQYVKYNTPLADKKELLSDNIILVCPETATGYLRLSKSKRKFIWWLSVNNYWGKVPRGIKGHISFLIKKVLFGNKTLYPILPKYFYKYRHLSQSQYAIDFLKKKQVENVNLLTDYLNEEHLGKICSSEGKINQVVYNPKKGVLLTKKVIEAYPDINFIPIQGMSAKEVGQLLDKSKIYIDFGEHPGKDRIPREAAMAGCVVITGRKGSAFNDKDVPIINEYKLDDLNVEQDLILVKNVGCLINSIFDDFEYHYEKFNNYRSVIVNEKHKFKCQVKKFIKDNAM